MQIKFLGAARNVTGSRFLIRTADKTILLDCGLYQEREFRARNWDKFPVEPSSIDCVLLTHAHIDHCGYLPKLVKDGFKGKVFCTAPTAEIAGIALLDSAHLQESDAEFKKKRHNKENRKGAHPEIPLYTVDDAQNTIPKFEEVPYEKPVTIYDGITAVFHDAGHILGASMIELRVKENGREKICVFSGDIGRWNRPILRDPYLFDKANFVFMESTYGNRSHHDEGDSSAVLAEVINDTRKRGGNIVIPTFAIERAQELLYCLSGLLRNNKIPHLLTFLDSPMAIKVTKVFTKYTSYFDREAKDIIKNGESLFNFPLLKMTSTANESKGINHIKGSTIIMAGSGMCTGGRIKHHLVHNIADPDSTILFVGYQANGTLGRIILEKHRDVRIFGGRHNVRAKIKKINGFSAHADRDELLKWISGFKQPPEKIFVIHGEANVSQEFAALLKNKISSNIIIPDYNEEHILK